MGPTEPNLRLFHKKILLGSKIKLDNFESQKSCHSPRIILLNNVMTPTSSAPAVALAVAAASASAAAVAFNFELDYQFKCTMRKGDIILGMGLRSPACRDTAAEHEQEVCRGQYTCQTH